MSSFKKDFVGLAQRNNNPTLFYLGNVHIKESQVFSAIAFALLSTIATMYVVADWDKIQSSWHMLF